MIKLRAFRLRVRKWLDLIWAKRSWLIYFLVICLAGWVGRSGWRFFQDRRLEGRSFVIGFEGSPSWLFSVDWASRQAIVISIPQNLLVPAPQGRGDYPFKGLERLPSTDGHNMSKEALEILFRVPLAIWEDGLTVDGEVSQVVFKEALGRYSRRCFFRGEGGELSRADCFRLWLTVRRIKTKNIRLVNLAQEFVLTQPYAQEEVKVLNIEKPVDWWRDGRFGQFDFGVANGTGKAGLATVAAQYIENLGGSVVKIGDWGEEVDRCQFRVKPELAKAVQPQLERLVSVFDCEVVEGGFGDYLVDVLLVVGREFECWSEGCQ
ncbi:LytR C-terminal domain-containing protein [Patescibacteria group bacterium]|nr:LytR C-terminal domain-containing protein [Patescibacteria group bacterium]